MGGIVVCFLAFCAVISFITCQRSNAVEICDLEGDVLENSICRRDSLTFRGSSCTTLTDKGSFTTEVHFKGEHICVKSHMGPK